MNPVTVEQGAGLIVFGQPHSGTYLPEPIKNRLTPIGRQLRDTDWHVPQLYAALLENATTVRANFHRYVIDANRPPDGTPLYADHPTSELIPLKTFDGEPIWQALPDDDDLASRLAKFYRPYHDALSAELQRVRSTHGVALLFDCHSIRSRIPRLFDGVLPVVNVGTYDGRSCAPELVEAARRACAEQNGFDYVVDGRFKGGWTTRQYGTPEQGVHALQMELAQRAYLESERHPFAYREDKAEPLRRLLRSVLRALEQQLMQLARSNP